MRTKTKSFFSLFALSCIMLLFPSCNPEALSVHDVEGEYEGKVDAELGGAPLGTIGVAQTVVTSPDNLKLRIAFENLKVAAYDLGNFVVDCGVQYVEREGRFDLYGEPQVVFETYGKVPVTVSGDANGGMIDLKLDISAPLNMKLEYTGFRKK